MVPVCQSVVNQNSKLGLFSFSFNSLTVVHLVMEKIQYLSLKITLRPTSQIPWTLLINKHPRL